MKATDIPLEERIIFAPDLADPHAAIAATRRKVAAVSN